MVGTHWIQQEKDFFTNVLLPMSQYSTGTYDVNSGRSFEDLAPIMQAAMVAQGINKRQYTKLGLFQHYYQKHSNRLLVNNTQAPAAANNLVGAAPRASKRPRLPRAGTATVAGTSESRASVLTRHQLVRTDSTNGFVPFDEDALVSGNSMAQESSSSAQRATRRSIDNKIEGFQSASKSSPGNAMAKRRKVVADTEDENYDGAFAPPFPNSSSRPFVPFDVPSPRQQSSLFRPYRNQNEGFRRRDDEPPRHSRARKARGKLEASPESFYERPASHQDRVRHSDKPYEGNGSSTLVPPTHEHRFQHLHGIIHNVRHPEEASPPAPLISGGPRIQSASEARPTGRPFIPVRPSDLSKAGPNRESDVGTEPASAAARPTSSSGKDDNEKSFDNEIRHELFHVLSKPANSKTLP